MLTEEQLAERRKGIGASEAAYIMSGKWYDLWLDKTGQKAIKIPLSDWQIAVRHAMEPIILDHYELMAASKVTHRGEAIISQNHPILRCTLDGFCEKSKRPIDAKCLDQWTGFRDRQSPQDWCVEHYAPQMQHQMLCCGAAAAALHVTVNMAEPFPLDFERDDFWLEEYIAKCEEFWGYVTRREPPPDAPPLAAPPTAVTDMRSVDMEGNNAWSSKAFDWLTNKDAAKVFEAAAKDLKAMIEPDVREAKGHGIIITRSKAGSLSIKETKEKRK